MIYRTAFIKVRHCPLRGTKRNFMCTLHNRLNVIELQIFKHRTVTYWNKGEAKQKKEMAK